MKRTPLRRRTPIRAKKRAAVKKKQKKSTKTRKPSMRLLKSKLWAECKRITRERHGNTCYTCGYSPLEGSNWQTGHGKTKGALGLQFQYDLRNLRPQCRACNVYNNGMTDIFIARLEKEEEGLAFLNESCYQDEYGAWKIKRLPPMGSMEAQEFVAKTLEEYRKMV